MITFESLNRYRACGLHLLVSASVVGVSAIVVFLLWYPGLLAYASGVYDIFLILLLVDVILGPLITLIIFNTKKKELKLDLFLVGCVQIAALIYGMTTLFSARPVFVVFNYDRFDVVYANDIKKENFNNSRVSQEFKHIPAWGPKIIAAQLPADENKAREIILSAVAGGDDVQNMPEYYVTYESLKAAVVKTAKPLSGIKKFNPENEVEVDGLINQVASKSDNFGFIPLVGKVKKLTVVVDLNTANIIVMSKLKPIDESFGVNSVNLKEVLNK